MIDRSTPRSRLEVVYLALQGLQAREIIEKVGTRSYLEYGEDNALLQELARIVDAALQEEVEKRRNAKK